VQLLVGYNVAAVDDYMSPDFVDHSVPPGLPADRDGIKMQFTMFFAALPDLKAKGFSTGQQEY